MYCWSDAGEAEKEIFVKIVSHREMDPWMDGGAT